MKILIKNKAEVNRDGCTKEEVLESEERQKTLQHLEAGAPSLLAARSAVSSSLRITCASSAEPITARLF